MSLHLLKLTYTTFHTLHGIQHSQKADEVGVIIILNSQMGKLKFEEVKILNLGNQGPITGNRQRLDFES